MEFLFKLCAEGWALGAGDYACWLGEEPNPRDLMAAFPCRFDADVADFDAGQQAREHSGADRGGNGRGVASPLLKVQ